jgi:putative transcriptional regulator
MGVHVVVEMTLKEPAGSGESMSGHAFEMIKGGIEGAIAIARGEADPTTYRVHAPAEVDVKAIRRKLGMTQARFAASFGFGLAAVQNWEQGRRRPEGAARAFLKVIEREPEAVRRALAA